MILYRDGSSHLGVGIHGSMPTARDGDCAELPGGRPEFMHVAASGKGVFNGGGHGAEGSIEILAPEGQFPVFASVAGGGVPSASGST